MPKHQQTPTEARDEAPALVPVPEVPAGPGETQPTTTVGDLSGNRLGSPAAHYPSHDINTGRRVPTPGKPLTEADMDTSDEPEPAKVWIEAHQNVTLGGRFVQVNTRDWVHDGVDVRETIAAGIVTQLDGPEGDDVNAISDAQRAAAAETARKEQAAQTQAVFDEEKRQREAASA